MPTPPRVVAVAPGTPAARAGLEPGDVVVAINGCSPRDVLDYQQLVDEADLDLALERDARPVSVSVTKAAGEPLGVEVHAAVFDQVRTCDNHCEFCFIHQLPPGLRPGLYDRDDDYRLSFLYGNFTTLTRFTEADLERVVTERLSPLNVSIHATDPAVRADLLRNRRGATSLRWLRALLDHGIEVHGQVVECPGRNDGEVLEDTMVGVLDRYPELASLCVVPLGVSRHNREPGLRPHTPAEAGRTLDTVHAWQEIFGDVLGRRLVHAADEYYLHAGRPFPPAAHYEGFAMYEDGVGMARCFELELTGAGASGATPQGGFAHLHGAPAVGYRAPRGSLPVARPGGTGKAVTALTGVLGAGVLGPLLAQAGFDEVEVLAVENRFFGGNVGVTGLLVGEDLARVLAQAPENRRYLLPDVCLSVGRFLDGLTPKDLPRPVEVVATDGAALRRALEG